MNKAKVKDIVLVNVFAVAFACVEAMIVVYSRIAFYPEGFKFPLVIIPMKIYFMELIRETSTLIMIFCVGYMFKGGKWEKFGAFVYAWGLWDILYYIWLYIFISWPPSLNTWDLLFLIPVPWVGPVWSPVSVAVIMMAFGVASWMLGERFKPDKYSLIMWIAGALTCFISFTWLAGVVIKGGTPENFPWYLTLSGDLLITMGLIRTVKKSSRTPNGS